MEEFCLSSITYNEGSRSGFTLTEHLAADRLTDRFRDQTWSRNEKILSPSLQDWTWRSRCQHLLPACLSLPPSLVPMRINKASLQPLHRHIYRWSNKQRLKCPTTRAAIQAEARQSGFQPVTVSHDNEVACGSRTAVGMLIRRQTSEERGGQKKRAAAHN